MKELRKVFPDKMIQYEKKNGLSPDGNGGAYNGNSIRKIMREDVIVSLQNFLDGDPLCSG